MPYTIDELQTLDFYNGFRNDLRAEHINKIVDYAKNKFRDENNVLYSFETIERDPELKSGLGIESSTLLSDQTGPYSEFPILLSQADMDAAEAGEDNFLEDLNAPGYIDDFEKFVRENSYSKQSVNNIYPDYNRRILNSVIERSFTELVEISVADSLPEGILNGDVIITTDATDSTKWLVTGNQKRKFMTNSAFYGEDYNYSELKALDDALLNLIPDGEPIE